MTGKSERTPKSAAKQASARLFAPRTKEARPGLSNVASPAREARV